MVRSDAGGIRKSSTNRRNRPMKGSIAMRKLALVVASFVLCLLAPAWAQQHQHAAPPAALATPERAQAQAPVPPLPRPAPAPGPGAHGGDMHAPTVFTLRSGIAEGRMVFLGVGGDINGKV